MGGSRPEGCIIGPRNTRTEEKSWGWRRMGASFEGWMDGQVKREDMGGPCACMR